MRRHTGGSLDARLRRIEDRTGPNVFRFTLDNGRPLDIPVDVCLAIICGRGIGEKWEPVITHIAGPGEESCGLLVGIVASMADYRRSGLSYDEWHTDRAEAPT